MDNRVPCKYGSTCYQKNEAHLQKYLHPEKSEKRTSSERDLGEKTEETSGDEPQSKIAKTEEHSLEKLTEMFLVSMPEEFLSFWKFCKKIKKDSPKDALNTFGFILCGPFDALTGDLKEKSQDEILCHSRYYYDPPEFQTLLYFKDKPSKHIGYFRDSPNDTPVFVAMNNEEDGCEIKSIASNLFSAVNYLLGEKIKTLSPFHVMSYKKIKSSLLSWAKENNIPIDDNTTMNNRNRKTVCKTFHKAGIVTPYNKSTTIGYRTLISEQDLRKLLDKITNATTEAKREEMSEELDLLITNANISNDENDFGGSLEFAINLFCYGDESLHTSIQNILTSTYILLNRRNFITIIKAHLKNRKKLVLTTK